MRLNSYFETGRKPSEDVQAVQPIPLHSFAFGPMGMAVSGQWEAIYRIAYERAIEALRPTWYDHAMKALAN